MARAKEPVHLNVGKWIEENEKFFLPPVCNKMMHDTQLKVSSIINLDERRVLFRNTATFDSLTVSLEHTRQFDNLCKYGRHLRQHHSIFRSLHFGS